MDNSNQNSDPNNTAASQPTWPAQTPPPTPTESMTTTPTEPAAAVPNQQFNNGQVNDYSGNPAPQPAWTPAPADSSTMGAAPTPMPTAPAAMAPTTIDTPQSPPPPADVFTQPVQAPVAAPTEPAPTIPDFMQTWTGQNNAAPVPQPTEQPAPAFTMPPPPTPIAVPATDMNSSPSSFSPPTNQPAGFPAPAGGVNPSDQLSPFFSQNDPGTFTTQTPSSSNPNGMQPEQGPSTLSQLTEPIPNVNPDIQTPPPVAANPLMPPAPATTPGLNQKNGKSMNKMLMAAGGVLLLIIFASSGYFIWLSSKSAPVAQSTSLPAEQSPLTNPPKPIVQEPKSAQAATSEAIISPSASPTASASAKSAFDILKDRSQKSSTAAAKKSST